MGSVLCLFFLLFLILFKAQSQPTTLLTDKGGFDVLMAVKGDVAIMPPVLSPELNEIMLKLSERKSWNISYQATPPLLLALAKVVHKEYETLGNDMNSL